MVISYWLVVSRTTNNAPINKQQKDKQQEDKYQCQSLYYNTNQVLKTSA